MSKNTADIYAASSMLESQFPGITERPKDSFTLVANFLPATASVVTSTNVVVSQDADFIWTNTTFTAFQTDNTTVVTNPSALVQYIDTSSGRQLSNAAGPLACVAGTGQEPFILSWPQILLRGTTLTVNLTNFEGTNRNYRLCFNGFKVYGAPLLNSRR